MFTLRLYILFLFLKWQREVETKEIIKNKGKADGHEHVLKTSGSLT